jgi:xanthine dehydrogenase accessory factor
MSNASWNWITALQELQKKARPAALATIVKTKGSTPRDIGAKILVTENEFFGTIGGGQLEELVIEKARGILKTHQGPERVPFPLCLKANQCCGGFVEVFIETVNTGPQVILFGAGHVAQAISVVLQNTPFRVHMVDSRAEWLDKAPSDVIKHRDSGLGFIQSWPAWNSEKTYAAVMTFDHDLDQDLVEKLLDKDLSYLGLIGSETKWKRFQKRLTEKGIRPELLQNVRCPMGLPIGGKTPQEVAISFAAEIVQIQNAQLQKSTSSATPHHIDEENSWMEELT